MDDARAIINECKTATDFDDGALNAWTVCCKEVGCVEEIMKVYERLSKAHPTHEEFASQYFMALVRVRDFRKQQQVARDMFKSFSKRPYLYWSIMSSVLQASDPRSDSTSSSMLLTLAERTVEKAITDGNFSAIEHLNLFLLILDLSKLHDRAIQLLLDDAACKFGENPLIAIENDRVRRLVDLYQKVGNWAKVNSLAISWIKEDNAEWSAYRAYFDSLTHLLQQEQPLADCHSTIAQAHEFLTGLAQGLSPGAFFISQVTRESRSRNSCRGSSCASALSFPCAA
eukprot:m.441145 g.441145  ORF g.441145 m.441145 type:complete len:285 (+) comp56795_c0_seq85:438-1292(+)